MNRELRKFYDSAMKERPALATVDNVRYEDYTGDVMPLWQFASINTASQMNKAIPILLAVKENTDELKEDVKGMREDIPAGICNPFQAGAGGCQGDKRTLGHVLKSGKP